MLIKGRFDNDLLCLQAAFAANRKTINEQLTNQKEFLDSQPSYTLPPPETLSHIPVTKKVPYITRPLYEHNPTKMIPL